MLREDARGAASGHSSTVSAFGPGPNGYTQRMSRAHLHEVPLPPPEKPERERQRRPEFEGPTLTVGAASAWVADLQRAAADFARRHGGSIMLALELGDGRRLVAREVRAGPGEGFVTLRHTVDGEERELGVRMDRIAAVELAPAAGDAERFTYRRADVGFGSGA